MVKGEVNDNYLRNFNSYIMTANKVILAGTCTYWRLIVG